MLKKEQKYRKTHSECQCTFSSHCVISLIQSTVIYNACFCQAAVYIWTFYVFSSFYIVNISINESSRDDDDERKTTILHEFIVHRQWTPWNCRRRKFWWRHNDAISVHFFLFSSSILLFFLSLWNSFLIAAHCGAMHIDRASRTVYWASHGNFNCGGSWFEMNIPVFQFVYTYERTYVSRPCILVLCRCFHWNAYAPTCSVSSLDFREKLIFSLAQNVFVISTISGGVVARYCGSTPDVCVYVKRTMGQDIMSRAEFKGHCIFYRQRSSIDDRETGCVSQISRLPAWWMHWFLPNTNETKWLYTSTHRGRWRRGCSILFSSRHKPRLCIRASTRS